MPIDINGLSAAYGQVGSNTPPVTVARNEATVAQQETGRPLTTETVTLTDMAQQLRSIEQNLASQPVVDSQRIEVIQQSLLDGHYDFNAERVADKFINFENQLEE